jgi:hypothetical protein
MATLLAYMGKIFLVDHWVEDGPVGLERGLAGCILFEGRPFSDGALVTFPVVVVESGLVKGIFVEGVVVPVADVSHAVFGVARLVSRDPSQIFHIQARDIFDAIVFP